MALNHANGTSNVSQFGCKYFGTHATNTNSVDQSVKIKRSTSQNRTDDSMTEIYE